MLKFLSILVGSLLIHNAVASANPPIPLVEGKDYTLLTVPIQKTAEPKGKVNVKEFFSYTCIHCKDIEPLVEQMIMPNKGVDLNKIQVVWNSQNELVGFAKLVATIQSMDLNRLNIPVFNAVFAHQNLNDQSTLKIFLEQNGLKPADVNKFMETYNSFTIAGIVGEYKSLTASYNINGTPTFIIADKYVASPAQPPRLIQVVQSLIYKAQQEAKAKK